RSVGEVLRALIRAAKRPDPFTAGMHQHALLSHGKDHAARLRIGDGVQRPGLVDRVACASLEDVILLRLGYSGQAHAGLPALPAVCGYLNFLAGPVAVVDAVWTVYRIPASSRQRGLRIALYSARLIKRPGAPAV